jgi:hypothetical protein
LGACQLICANTVSLIRLRICWKASKPGGNTNALCWWALAALELYRASSGIVPYGVFLGSPTPERYRPLEGNLTYRYFMPVRKPFWWLGMTSHLECYGLALARAAVILGETRYRDLALRQFEWVMGANPFGACLMTGEGMRNPYPCAL